MGGALDANRAHWDELADRHGQDAYYDLAGFLAGKSSLREAELAAVGDPSGLDLIHLQCHFGLDTLSWARLGARVTGVDFSATAIRRARELAEQARLTANFVDADVLALPAELTGRYDVVVATYGVLSWASDVTAWMRSAASTLRPSGRLALVDLHPLLLMPDSLDPLVLDFPYGGGEAHEFNDASSYADSEIRVAASRTVQWPHSLGEIVTAAVAAGLRIDRLVEHLSTDGDDRGLLPRDADGRYRFVLGGQPLPVLYSLLATLPAA